MKSVFIRRTVLALAFSALISTLLISLNAGDLDVDVYSEQEGGNNLILEFTSNTNLYFQFWGTTSLSTGQWDTVRGISLGANGRQCWVDRSVLLDYDSFFYKVKPISLDAPEDLDRDGIDDVFELNHALLNPLLSSDALRDFDHDGVNNVMEYEFSTDLLNADTDGDLMPDEWEINYHYHVAGPALRSDGFETDGLDPLDGSDDMEDPDGDGYGNIYEFMHGSDPLVASSQPASTFYVVSGAVGGDGSQAQPFGTIQAALNVASSYAIIELADGVYSGSGNRGVDYLGKPVMVKSTNGAERCVIDCGGVDRGFVFYQKESIRSVLCGVTIRNGFSWSGNGGGIFCFDASPFIQRCVIERCDAVCGGGISCAYASPFIYNSVITANRVYTYGGGIFAEQNSHPRIQNCTIAGNETLHDGGGVYSTVLSAPLVRNSIVWGNAPDALDGVALQVEYSCVEGGVAGLGNFATDPQLAKGRCRLTAASPCIDAGIETNMLPIDFDWEATYDDPGHANVISAVDVGADEFVDADSDGMADDWEIRFFGNLSHSGTADGDIGGSDGLTDLEEYQEDSNPTLRDTDADGILDGMEVDTYLTSPILADTDRDYMPDGWELTYGLNPLLADVDEASADPDDDGYPNVYEAFHGSLPNDAESIPQATLFVDASVGGSGDGSRTSPFSRISDAVDAAQDLDIIELSAGRYAGSGNTSVSLLGKPIMLTGTNAALCQMDGEFTARGFVFSRGEDRRSVVRNLVVKNCKVVSSGTCGGAVLCSNASPSFISCSFVSNNMANGAAIAVFSGSPRLKDCVFENNLAASYGALYFKNANDVLVDGCEVFGGNEYYASVYFAYCSNMVVRNTSIYDNRLAMSLDYSEGLLEGCTIADNRSHGVKISRSDVKIHKTSIVNNEIGLYVYYSCDVAVSNSLLWGNAQSYTNRSTLSVDYSCVEGGFSGTGNISVDPQLTALGHRLKAGSPCIDAGRNSSALDRDGEAQWDDPAHANVAGGISDMGSDEFVDTDNDDMADSWEIMQFGNLDTLATEDSDALGGADGLTALQEYNHGTNPNRADSDGDGLNDADEVLVYLSHPLCVDTDRDGIDDGWEATYGLDLLVADAMEDPDGDRYPTYYEYVNACNPTSSASIPSANLYVNASTGNDAAGYGSAMWPLRSIGVAIERAADDAIIMVADGLYAGVDNRNIMPAGKRVLVMSANGPENCVMDCGRVQNGFYFNGAETEKTVVSGLTIKNGATTGYGGGMYFLSASPCIVDCVMVSNNAVSGGALAGYESAAVIKNCVIAHNSVRTAGGAAWLRGAPQLINCTINDNRAGDGGALYFYSGTGRVINCTIVDNLATNMAGGVMVYRYASPIFNNSIIWGNGKGALVTTNVTQAPIVTYSCVQDGFSGVGNITNNPQLTPYCYQLTQDSPCIDAGEDNGIAYDRAGRSRYDVSTVPNGVSVYDIGAVEFIDSDNDGMPDWWEQQHFGNLTQNGTLDNDVTGGADGLTDLQEYEYGTDPENADSDQDGLMDGEEVLTYLTHPMMNDTDGDFTGDGWEVSYGFDPLDVYDGTVDHDGDRFDNIYECFHGSNPTNAQDYPVATVFVDAAVTGVGSGTIGSPYRSIQFAISNAVAYDIIQLADGRYPGVVDCDINLGGRAVMIVSENGADSCIVDLEHRGQGFVIEKQEDARTVICDLTVCNATDYSGGAFKVYTSHPQIRSCNIYSNHADSAGAGIYLLRSEAIIRDCHFLRNSAPRGSAAYITSWLPESASDPWLENNRIIDNEISDCAVVYIDKVSPRLYNNTIYSNRMSASTTNTFAGIYCRYGADPLIVNSIVWNGGNDEVWPTSVRVEYSCVRGGYAGTGNISTDPKLAPVSGRLLGNSPCIDAGCIVPTTMDFEHEQRWDDPSVANAVSAVDMGADEWVDTDSDALPDSWEMKYIGNLLQNAAADGDGDTLSNAQEYEYATNPDSADSDNDLLRDDAEIYSHGTIPYVADTDGDYVGDGWELLYGFDALDASDGMDDPDLDHYPNLYEFMHGSVPTNGVSVPAPTLYVDASASAGGDGSQGSPFRRIHDATGCAPYDVVQIASGRYLMETGYAKFFNPVLLISEYGPTGTVVDCMNRLSCTQFKDSPGVRSALSGITFAGVSNQYSTCVEVNSSGLLVENCVFTNNQSLFATGVYCYNSTLLMRNTRMVDNLSWVAGVLDFNGGIGCKVENCVIANNLVLSGAAIDLSGGVDVEFNHVSVAYNVCVGIRAQNDSVLSLSNSVVWRNSSTEIYLTNATASVDYSCIDGGYVGAGNISVDPLITPLTGRLRGGSPCIDAVTSAVLSDMDGEQAWDDPDHVNGTAIRDMGADEFVDMDSDDMGDAWEVLFFGNLSHSGGGDGDSDGATDLEEYEAGTDPTRG